MKTLLKNTSTGIRKIKSLLLLLILLVPFCGMAQEDAEGCKDHPLLTRINNFYITGCKENYNEMEIRTSPNKTEMQEGNLFTLYYLFNGVSGEKMKSPLQVIKNYENAIVKIGGKLVYRNTNFLDTDIEATFYLSTTEKEYWIRLFSFGGTPNEVERFTLFVLEMENMKQEVDATQMFEAINKDGYVALYINFETGKSDIKAESEPIIEQIAEMLKKNPSLKVSREGHTDNVGAEKSNQVLSESRAKSVVEALVAKGINANRLASKGWGQSKPVADNQTEEGRAKNRRVEIVKQ